MKSMSTLAVAAVLALTGAGIASAQTVYHVSGSTAYRVADVSAEVNYLSSLGKGGVVAAYISTASNLTAASTSVVATGDHSVIFSNVFNGSILGDESVSGVTVPGTTSNKIAFPQLPSGTLGTVATANTTTPAAGGTPVTSFTTEAATYADIAFSDVSFGTAKKIMAKASPTTTPAANDGGTVGIVPFVFVANITSDVTDFGSTTVSSGTATETVTVSVTPQNFSNLWASGGITGAVFTGVNADENITVLPLGRDIDSGTRATALAETGYGLKGSGAIAVTSAMQQQYPLDSTGGIVGNTGNGPIESFETVPATAVDGITLAAGNSGYSSGGNLAKALSTKIDVSASGSPHTVLIGYLGVSDAVTALTATSTTGTNRQPAQLLAYNGSIFNPAALTGGFASATDLAKIYEGQYTYWGFEHVYYNSNNAGTSGNQNSANPSSIVTGLVTQLTTDGIDVLSSAGVHAASMVVSRSDDGLLVN